MKKQILVGILTLGMGLGAQAVSVPLAPATLVPLAGAVTTTVGGTATLVDSLIGALYGPTPGAASINGTVNSFVYSGDVNNPYGLTGLTFVYRVFNDSSSIGVVEHLTVNNYDAFLVSVGTDASVGTDDPLSVNRSLLGTPVSFNFGFSGAAALMPGQSSHLLILQTSATRYERQIGAVIDGASANVFILGPTVSVPDGGMTVALLGLALGGLGLIRRKLIA